MSWLLGITKWHDQATKALDNSTSTATTSDQPTMTEGLQDGQGEISSLWQ